MNQNPNSDAWNRNERGSAIYDHGALLPVPGSQRIHGSPGAVGIPSRVSCFPETEAEASEPVPVPAGAEAPGPTDKLPGSRS